ncbi:hypothetical protein V6N13_020976 [Hibiscus sabdariffa]
MNKQDFHKIFVWNVGPRPKVENFSKRLPVGSFASLSVSPCSIFLSEKYSPSRPATSSVRLNVIMFTGCILERACDLFRCSDSSLFSERFDFDYPLGW